MESIRYAKQLLKLNPGLQRFCSCLAKSVIRLAIFLQVLCRPRREFRIRLVIESNSGNLCPQLNMKSVACFSTFLSLPPLAIVIATDLLSACLPHQTNCLNYPNP